MAISFLCTVFEVQIKWEMKWIIILFLLSSACDNPDYVIDDYASLTDGQMKCIVKNATPVNQSTDIIIDEKYYKPTDPKLEECLKNL